ncbi:MAG: FmdE family protein [Chloroflexi bacterium]|nr:FmdE family protein [Chloroflexota bacterium]
MYDLRPYLAESSKRHSHLCPRLVLGVRMALAGAQTLELEIPRLDKDLLVIAETDGCFLGGLEVTAGVSPGHRTLRIEDYGKVAATFVDVRTGTAIRLAPRPDVRVRARDYAPGETRHYFAQLIGYQIMPDEELFSMTPVVLSTSVGDLISRAGVRTTCVLCGEEIINEREIVVDGVAYCRSCWGQTYYQVAVPLLELTGNVQWPQMAEVFCALQEYAAAPEKRPIFR